MADEFSFAFSALGNGFAVGNLRSTGIGFDVELAFQAVADDFQMQLTHTRDNQLAGIFVGEHLEGWIFFSETGQAVTHLIPVIFRLWLDRHADDGFGERRRFQGYIEIFIAQGISGPDVAETDQRGDVTGVDRLYVLSFATLNDHQPADAFAAAATRIIDGIAFFQLSSVHAEEHQFSGIGVSPKLKC